MLCVRCLSPITSKRATKYCSPRCSKLYLKAQYKKRNREKQNAYQREYRKAQNGGDRPKTSTATLRDEDCLACGSIHDLQLAHVKPRTLGGRYNHAITLCRDCHMAWDMLNKQFWLDGYLKAESRAKAQALLPQSEAA